MGTVSALATAEKHFTGRQGLVIVRGDVSVTVGGRLMKENGLWLRESAVLSQVVDYTRASICMDTEAMLSNAKSAAAHADEFANPTVFVVTSAQLPLFAEYTRLMREGGLFQRAVFTDACAAHEWAARHVQVREYWMRCRKLRLATSRELPSTGSAGLP